MTIRIIMDDNRAVSWFSFHVTEYRLQMCQSSTHLVYT